MQQGRLSAPDRAEVAVQAAIRRRPAQDLSVQHGNGKHLFCSVCGIKSFYVPRSHPDGFSVNARCLDAGTVQGMTVKKMDGVNWEQSHPKGGSG
jgi:hypothetical protein